jgi:hypothetical protein
MIVQLSDFQTGKFELHTGMYDHARIQNYIDLYEIRYIRDLLGVSLGDLFVDDFVLGGGAPADPIFVIIYNPLSYDLNFSVYQSNGMKQMLVGFIYWEIVRDYQNQMTPIGNVIPSGENSVRSSTLTSTLWDRYNEAILSYRAIQRYIAQNPSDYPDFNGQTKLFSTWI